MNADPILQTLDSASNPLGSSEDTHFSSALHLDAAQAGPLVLGDDPWFLRAEFGRDGADLQLTGEEGQQVVIKDYFSQATPPDLASASGAVLNADTAARLAGPLAPGQYAQAATGPGANPIGRVETASGDVQVTRADGSEVTLSQGDPVFLGDILETSSDAAVGITFADESTFSMGEDGRMTLDDMVYDPGGQVGSMQVNLLQGAFTFVSGQIAKTDPNAMVITTPTSTIGIRGTAGGGSVDSLGGTTAALMPEADGFVGEMTIGNAAGFQTINQALQAVNIISSNDAPSQPFIMTPQQMGQTFGGALNALPNAANSIPGSIVEGANEGRTIQQEAQQAAEEAEANQADAEAQALEAEAQAQEAAAEAEAAEQAEAEAVAEAQAAELAAEEALAAAQAAAAEAEAATATPEQIAAAEEAAQAAEEAQAIADQAAAEAEQAQSVTAQTQALSAEAEANSASANADLAQATVAVIEAQVGVIETSSSGAVASAAVAAGLDGVAGVNELNAAQEAVVEAQTQLQEAVAVAQQAETAAQEALALAQVAPTDTQVADAATQAAEDAIANGASAEEVFTAAADAAAEQASSEGDTPEEIEAAKAAAQAAFDEAIANGATPEEALQAALASTADGNVEANATPDGDPLFSPQSVGGTEGPQGPEGPEIADTSNPTPDNGSNDTFGGFDYTSVLDSGPDAFTFDAFTNPTGFDPFAGTGPDVPPPVLPPIEAVEPPPEDEDGPPITDVFPEVFSGTPGNDTQIGGPGNTQFTMVQGSTLGGDDVLFGGAGTDEITLENLNLFQGVYDASDASANPADPKIVFSTSTGSLTGTIQLSSIEQLYVNDGSATGNVRLNVDDSSVGFGYVVAGGAGGDIISVAPTGDMNNVISGANFNFGASNFSISDSTTLGTILFGKGGADDITGSGKEDKIFGGDGNDTLTGGAGNDSLYGGANDDIIHTEGSDDVDGGADNDTIIMSSLGDSLVVSNVETITGGAGTDIVFLTDVTNTLTASDVETIHGGSGVDTITITGSTDVTVTAGDGDDFITGGAGADILNGGFGADTLIGGEGQNVLTGGDGSDTLTGGTGNDIFRYTSVSESQVGTLRDVITNFSTTDSIEDIFLEGLLHGTFDFLGEHSVAYGNSGNTEARFNNTSEVLEIDVDGNGVTDMEIELTGVLAANIDESDFTVT